VVRFFCDGVPHLDRVRFRSGGAAEGFHVPLAVLIAPVGVEAAKLLSHGDLLETVLLRGALVLGFLAARIYRVYP
jgi:hypothetical protein